MDNFDWIFYINKYKDLQKAGINTKEKAYSHWIRYGKKEKRICNNKFIKKIINSDNITNNKKNIYYLLGNVPSIKPISGDQITEISIMKCLNKYYNIYYNNQLINFNLPDFGQYKTIVELPSKKYDYYWVRNNDNILLKCDGIKVRCGVPYNEDAYKQSDIILCYTNTWKNNLLSYNLSSNKKPSSNLYPNHDIIIPKKILITYQTVEERFFNNINKEVKINIINKILNNVEPDLLIGYFGRIADTCNPDFFIKAFNLLCNKYPRKKIKFIICTTNRHRKINIDHLNKNKNIILLNNGIPHNKIHEYIKSMNIIVSNYTSEMVDWGGCMHILEAMASGIPIICGNFDIRKEQLGEDYELFWNKDNNENDRILEIFNILCNIIEQKIDLNKIQNNIKLRAEFYKNNNVADFIYNQLENI